MLSSRMCKSETILNKITLTTEVKSIDIFCFLQINRYLYILLLVNLKTEKWAFFWHFSIYSNLSSIDFTKPVHLKWYIIHTLLFDSTRNNQFYQLPYNSYTYNIVITLPIHRAMFAAESPVKAPSTDIVNRRGPCTMEQLTLPDLLKPLTVTYHLCLLTVTNTSWFICLSWLNIYVSSTFCWMYFIILQCIKFL